MTVQHAVTGHTNMCYLIETYALLFFYLCGWGAGFVGLFLMDKISHV